MGLRAVILGALAALVALPAMAATGDRLDRSRLGAVEWSEEFDGLAGSRPALFIDRQDAPWRSDYANGPPWRWPDGTIPTRDDRFKSRVLLGERQVYVDQTHAGRNPFWIGHGALRITAARADPAALKAMQPAAYLARSVETGRRDHYSGLLVSTRLVPPLRYVEMRLICPHVSGAWCAGWMLSDRGDEFDLAEHWGGAPWVTTAKGDRVRLASRAGTMQSAVHFADKRPHVSNALWAAGRRLKPNTWARYGVLWTAREAIFYRDDIEVHRVAVAFTDPMRVLLNLAVSDTAGPPEEGAYPATMLVDYVRVSTLVPAQ